MKPLILRVTHAAQWYLRDLKFRIYCFLGFHEWHATGLLMAYGTLHHVKCERCGTESWFNEYEFGRFKVGAR